MYIYIYIIYIYIYNTGSDAATCHAKDQAKTTRLRGSTGRHVSRCVRAVLSRHAAPQSDRAAVVHTQTQEIGGFDSRPCLIREGRKP